MNISCEDRGVVVTESSNWTFDGHGRYRRSPRGQRVMVACVDGALDYDDWHPFEVAELATDLTTGEVRLRLLPPDRPAGSIGILSGVVLYTNLVPESHRGAAGFGAPDEWFAPSPVPADKDLWPGELPFTAFGQFGPDALDLRVFDQDIYWVDRSGNPHLISEMSQGHVENVVAMLTEFAEKYHQATVLRESVQAIGDTMLGRPNVKTLLDDLEVGSVASADALDWLHSTPLMRSLLTPRN